MSKRVRSRIETMAPTLTREPFHHDGWVYKEKYDGWRMLAYKDGASVRLISRQHVDHTAAHFPDLVSAVARLPTRRLIQDGEVCLRRQMVSQFHLLGDDRPEERAVPPAFMTLWDGSIHS